MPPLPLVTLYRGSLDTRAFSDEDRTTKEGGRLVLVAPALICLLWIITPTFAQEPSTRTISAPKYNIQQRKPPVDLSLKARRGVLPYGRILRTALASRIADFLIIDRRRGSLGQTVVGGSGPSFASNRFMRSEELFA